MGQTLNQKIIAKASGKKGCVAKTSDTLVKRGFVLTVARPTHLIHESQATVQMASFPI